MLEQYPNILITGAFTLLGVILGGALPFLIEIYRRKWIVSDRKYERRKEVLDRRCNQAEAYIQTVTEDFGHIKHNTEIYLLDLDDHHTIELTEARRRWVEQLDMKVFALGPAIRSLNDKELNKIFDNMMDTMDKLKDANTKSRQRKFEGDISVDPVLLHKKVQDIWLEYSKLNGDFYKRLDTIRNISLE